MKPSLKRKREDPTSPYKPPKKAKTDHQAVLTLKRDVRKLKRANETHAFDVYYNVGLTSTAISATYPSLVTCLNCPLLGDYVNNRQGNEVLSIGIKLRGAIYSTRDELTAQTFRVIVFADSENHGLASPLVIGAGTGNAFLDINGVLVENLMPVWQNKKRYKVLYDKTIINQPAAILDYDPVSGNSSQVMARANRFETYIPFSRIISYNQANQALASDIQKNAIYLAIFSDQSTNLAFTNANASFLSRWYFCES